MSIVSLNAVVAKSVKDLVPCLDVCVVVGHAGGKGDGVYGVGLGKFVSDVVNVAEGVFNPTGKSVDNCFVVFHVSSITEIPGYGRP